MSALAKIPVTEAMKCDYELMRSLVAVSALDWIVVLTNPNCEERALKSLKAAGLIAYQPLEPIGRTRKGQRKSVIDASRPFFRRYVFVGLDRLAGDGAETVRGCDGVEKILTFHFDQRPHIVPAKEMQIIMEAAWRAQTDREYVVPQHFSIGEMIRLATTAFAGINVPVSAYDALKGTLKVEVDVMGRPVSVTVPVDKVSKL